MVARQYDVVRNGDTPKTGKTPYVIVIQADINDRLPTVIVAPIMKLKSAEVVPRLNVPITVEGRDYYIVMQEMSVLIWSRLRTVVENRSDLHRPVVAAVDLLFTGV